MKLYTQTDISEIIGKSRSYVSDLLFLFQINPIEIKGRYGSYCYNIYQIDILNEYLKIRKKKNLNKLYFDFENEEIYTIKESNIKNVHLTYKGNNTK